MGIRLLAAEPLEGGTADGGMKPKFRREGKLIFTPRFKCDSTGSAKVDSRELNGEALPMFKRVGHFLLIVALVAATGGHWFVLQSVAWTSMLAENLRGAALIQAVEKTFDGDHPCALCKAIKVGKKSEKKAEFPGSLKKMEFYSTRTEFIFCAPESFFLTVSAPPDSSGIDRAPSVPPPRLFPA